jgi:hypothetical protein
VITRKSGLALGLTLFCLAAGASTASANTVECFGGAGPNSTRTEIAYGFGCSEPIKGFGLVSSVEVGDFSTTADVFDSSFEPVSGQTFTCEGGIPSSGFGCFGTAEGNRTITGTFGVDSPICVKRRTTLSVWIVAIDSAGTPSGPQPLVVRAGCAKQKPKPARHRKHR